MLAGGADEEAAVDLGACSATKDILSGSMRWMGCYWRMEELTGESWSREVEDLSVQ